MTDLPEDWQIVALRDLVDVLDSKRVPLSAAERKHREGSVPYYGATGQVGTIDKHIFDEPLVLLGEDGVQFFDPYKPKAYKIVGPSWVNNHAHVLRPKSGVIELGYLLHYLNAFDYRGYANGTTRLKLTQGAMNSIPVRLPTIDDQRRIVEALDEHLSRLDKALAEAQHSAQATSRFSASLLHSMFTGELMQRELGIEELHLTALAEVADVQSGGTPKGLDRLSSEAATGDHTVPFYKVGDMNLDARYMKASRSYLTHKDIDALRLKVIPSGSVVFPKAGGAIATDKKRLVQVPGPIDLNCMAVIPGHTVLSSYLAWWFESFKLSDLSNGSILPQIGKTAVMQVQLPIPSLADQEKVVNYLEEKISLVRAQALSIDEAEASIATLMRSVLNVAFSGKLVKRY